MKTPELDKVIIKLKADQTDPDMLREFKDIKIALNTVGRIRSKCCRCDCDGWAETESVFCKECKKGYE